MEERGRRGCEGCEVTVSGDRFIQANGIEVVVQTLTRQKFCVSALLDQFPLIQDQNSVGPLDG